MLGAPSLERSIASDEVFRIPINGLMVILGVLSFCGGSTHV